MCAVAPGAFIGGQKVLEAIIHLLFGEGWICVGAVGVLFLLVLACAPKETEEMKARRERRKAHGHYPCKVRDSLRRDEERIKFAIDRRPRKCSTCGLICSRTRWNHNGGCPRCGCDFATLVDDPRYPPE
jgi:hypothetical protein